MKTIFFLTIWIGVAVLHTLYELKIRPYLDTFRKDTGTWPFSK